MKIEFYLIDTILYKVDINMHVDLQAVFSTNNYKNLKQKNIFLEEFAIQSTK